MALGDSEIGRGCSERKCSSHCRRPVSLKSIACKLFSSPIVDLKSSLREGHDLCKRLLAGLAPHDSSDATVSLEPSWSQLHTRFWQSCKFWAQEQRPGFRVAGEPRLESVPASAEQPETTKLRMHLPLQLHQKEPADVLRRAPCPDKRRSLVPEPPFQSAEALLLHTLSSETFRVPAGTS